MARIAKNLTPTPTDAGETAKRNYRTPEQQIEDLQAKIRSIEKRAAAKKAKATDHGKALFAAAKALDKAIEAAEEAGAADMAKACGSARAILSECMVAMGVRMPESRRGRRPADAAA